MVFQVFSDFLLKNVIFLKNGKMIYFPKYDQNGLKAFLEKCVLCIFMQIMHILNFLVSF